MACQAPSSTCVSSSVSSPLEAQLRRMTMAQVDEGLLTGPQTVTVRASAGGAAWGRSGRDGLGLQGPRLPQEKVGLLGAGEPVLATVGLSGLSS